MRPDGVGRVLSVHACRTAMGIWFDIVTVCLPLAYSWNALTSILCFLQWLMLYNRIYHGSNQLRHKEGWLSSSTSLSIRAISSHRFVFSWRCLDIVQSRRPVTTLTTTRKSNEVLTSCTASASTGLGEFHLLSRLCFIFSSTLTFLLWPSRKQSTASKRVVKLCFL